ncbi:MAG: response regulator [Candidatus Solibacter usitatus]|nr:response regulator [Candidatus Solibacter usitatus]
MTKSVMIVDDSPVMRSFVKRTIAVAGLEISSCIEACNGREALERLRSAAQSGTRIDLILTDINMPVLDGEGLLQELRRDPDLGRIPVVVVSTDSTDQRVHTLMRLGASDYVRKPFPPEKLFEVLSGLFPEWSGP